jgi:hypothetical protein
MFIFQVHGGSTNTAGPRCKTSHRNLYEPLVEVRHGATVQRA